MKKIVFIIVSMYAATSLAALNFKSNVPKDVKDQMIQDLEFMGTVDGFGATPFHKEIFGDVKGAVYKKFIDTRIESVGMDSCGGGAAVACVQPYYDANTMWLTKNYVNFSHPQVARSMIIYHEARHTEEKNSFWFHGYCPVPFKDDANNDKRSIWTGAMLEGEPACDINYRGSYGSSTILLKNISKYCVNCSSKVRMDADIYAMDQLERIVDPTTKQKMLKDFEAP